MAAAICEISNCHCTQLNYCLFTNHSPLVSWQQYLTTIADFSLNSTVIHSPTTPLWYHGSNTQPPIANFSLNSTVIHSPTTPLSWQQYSTTYCQFFTQLNCHSFTNHSTLVSWQQYSITIADSSLNSAANPLHSGNMAAIVLSHHC